MKFGLNPIPSEYKNEFYEKLFYMNAARMITLFLILAAIEAILFLGEVIFESNTEGIEKILVIKLMFVGISIFFVTVLWLLKKYKCFNILRIFVIVAVFATILLAIYNTLAAQALVSDISIYIMILYTTIAVIRISHIYYIVINSLCFVYFAFGMQSVQTDTQFAKGSIINGIILNLIAIIIARILYSQHIEIFLDKIKINSKIQTLKYMAEHDGLTNLYNHHTISSIIERQKEFCKESKSDLCLAVIDIDDFKKINDEYGHVIGDQTLKDIAQKIKENVREHDFVGRYGGDEFVILFPGITVVEANKICDRILESIHQVEVTKVKITGSIGLVSLTESNYHDFIEKADMLMYKAKNTGKSQIIS